MFDYCLGMMTAMGRKGAKEMALRVTIGFAFGDREEGVAYARVLGSREPEHVQRITVPFRPQPALLGRDGAYAVLLAVAAELRKQGVRDTVQFEIADEALVRDLADRRPVPAPLAMPYVLLGCALNRFKSASVRLGDAPACRDLTARARADISINVAA
jgi:hypothetical protein